MAEGRRKEPIELRPLLASPLASLRPLLASPAASLTPKTMVVNPLQSVASVRFASQLVAKPIDSLV